jgi:hypothetical protein
MSTKTAQRLLRACCITCTVTVPRALTVASLRLSLRCTLSLRAIAAGGTLGRIALEVRETTKMLTVVSLAPETKLGGWRRAVTYGDDVVHALVGMRDAATDLGHEADQDVGARLQVHRDPLDTSP